MPEHATTPGASHAPGVVARATLRLEPPHWVDGPRRCAAEVAPDHRPSRNANSGAGVTSKQANAPGPGGPRPRAFAPYTETAPGSSPPGPVVARSTR
jgi:hypothetical protein